MPTVLYANGAIPQSALDPIPAANGQTAYLLPLPAASFLRVAEKCQRLYGWAPQATSAGDGFRSLARQISVFTQRYRRTYAEYAPGRVDRRTWNGVYYYRWNGPAAAVPGTSNHGKGITVDITDLGGYSGKKFSQIKALLIAEGWSNAEGASIGESWHWNYTRTAYGVDNTNITIPGIGLPDIDTVLDSLEEYMATEDARVLLSQILEALTLPGAPYQVPEAILAAVQENARTLATIQGQGDAELALLRVVDQPFGYPQANNVAIQAVEARLIAQEALIRSLAGGTNPADAATLQKVVEDALADFKASLTVQISPAK